MDISQLNEYTPLPVHTTAGVASKPKCKQEQAYSPVEIISIPDASEACKTNLKNKKDISHRDYRARKKPKRIIYVLKKQRF